MIWLIRKIFGLGVFVALIFLALQFQVAGRPVKDYVIEFYQTPLIQEAVRQAQEAFSSRFGAKQDRTSIETTPPLEDLDDKERSDLDHLLKDLGKRP